MQGQRFWIEDGKIGTALDHDTPLSAPQEKTKFERGHVRVTTGSLGTEIKWHVQTPYVASLFAAAEWLRAEVQMPLVLRFYVSGWFEEFHKNIETSISRLDDIIARGDRHFTCRTLVKQFELTEKQLPTLLSECINKPANAADYAVECAFEENSEQFTVHKIGPKSVIGKVWGMFPSTFPCQTAGQYSQVVSEAYRDVLTSGRPRYDHVLAAMRMPDNLLFWVPYQRLVLPKAGGGKTPSVLVISELSQVDIQLI